MKLLNRRSSLLAIVLSAALVRGAAAQDVDNGDFGVNPGLALLNPDKFNWGLLVAISRKAPDNLQFSESGNTTNNAVWETWADDNLTFPKAPDPSVPPKWADRNNRITPHAITQLQLRARRMKNAFHAEAILPAGGGEVVFRNKSSFDFLIKNNLFYQEGLAEAFKKGVDGNGFSTGVKLEFDPTAVEIKAVYQPLSETLTKDNCHWNYAVDGKAYGLVALHIMSKQLPNWTWATWEWSGNTPDQPNGNPGRSDWYGSRDTFGVVYKNASHFQAPNPPGNSGKLYPSGTVSDDLNKMFAEAGYSPEWIKEWSNYRLKGSQIDFTDSAGAAVLVGNSVTEKGFVQTSSCMTCHANAAIAPTGLPNPSIGFTLDGQSRNGPLDPAWFYDVNDSDPSQQFSRYKTKYYPVDFVWAVLNASPKKP